MADVKQDYDIETRTVMFQKGQHFDVLAVGKAPSPWWNRTLCEVNNAWVRLGVMEGHLDIELEGETISLKPGEAFTIPRGVTHCPHARGRSVVLMMENAGVVPTGS
jgi:hypothetical protein